MIVNILNLDSPQEYQKSFLHSGASGSRGWWVNTRSNVYYYVYHSGVIFFNPSTNSIGIAQPTRNDVDIVVKMKNEPVIDISFKDNTNEN